MLLPPLERGEAGAHDLVNQEEVAGDHRAGVNHLGEKMDIIFIFFWGKIMSGAGNESKQNKRRHQAFFSFSVRKKPLKSEIGTKTNDLVEHI